MPQVYHSLEDHHSPIAAVPKGTLGNGETLAAILLCVAIFQTSASQGLIRTYCCHCPCLAHARQRHAAVKLYVASESGRRCLGPSVIRVQGQWSKDRMVGLPLLDLFAGIPFGRFDSGPFDQRRASI